jgi:hypothetical protein
MLRNDGGIIGDQEDIPLKKTAYCVASLNSRGPRVAGGLPYQLSR